MSAKLRRVLAFGAFAVIAAAGPGYVAMSSPETTAQPSGECLAWLGARGTGKCIGQAYDGQIGPQFNFGTQNNPNNGFSTGPLFPGQTFTNSVSP